MDQTKVLIVGAGPTGLTLALWLTKAGIPIRIIDKTERPGSTSRAMVLHARNLEFYHQLGIDQLAVAGGFEMKTINLWIRGKRAARLPIGDFGMHSRVGPKGNLIHPIFVHGKFHIATTNADDLNKFRSTIEITKGIISSYRDDVEKLNHQADSLIGFLKEEYSM